MPAFNPKILQSFIEIFEKHSTILTHELAAQVNGNEFDVFKYVSVCTFNIVCGKNIMTREIVDTLIAKKKRLFFFKLFVINYYFNNYFTFFS